MSTQLERISKLEGQAEELETKIEGLIEAIDERIDGPLSEWSILEKKVETLISTLKRHWGTIEINDTDIREEVTKLGTIVQAIDVRLDKHVFEAGAHDAFYIAQKRKEAGR